MYAIGGWADGYTNAVLRLMEGLPGPRKGLIGPWSHAWPEHVTPGPAIGFRQEALRWWDHWLKGVDTGIMDEPMLRVWMQDFVEPAPLIAEQPGRWVAEDAWPSAVAAPALTPTAYCADPRRHRIDAAPRGADGGASSILGSQLIGADAGAWCAEGQPSDWAPDQRAAEDGRS